MNRILALLLLTISFAFEPTTLARTNPEYEFNPDAAPPVAAKGDHEEDPAARNRLNDGMTNAKPCKECEVYANSSLLNSRPQVPRGRAGEAGDGYDTTK